MKRFTSNDEIENLCEAMIKDFFKSKHYTNVMCVDIEADSSGTTEAGTRQRGVIRMGVVEIAVTFSVTAKWVKTLTAFKQRESISVQYLDPEIGERHTTEMYIDGY